MSINRKKLREIAGKSPWEQQARERLQNRQWKKLAAKIAVRILSRLDELNWKQKDLAEKLGVSPQQVNKIVRGKENLTLDAISRLENVLGTDLLTEVKTKEIIVFKVAEEKMQYTTGHRIFDKKYIGFSIEA